MVLSHQCPSPVVGGVGEVCLLVVVSDSIKQLHIHAISALASRTSLGLTKEVLTGWQDNFIFIREPVSCYLFIPTLHVGFFLMLTSGFIIVVGAPAIMPLMQTERRRREGQRGKSTPLR
jgi:hypothetical protein